MGATHTSTVIADVKANLKALSEGISTTFELVEKGEIAIARRVFDAARAVETARELAVGVAMLQKKMVNLQLNQAKGQQTLSM